MRVWLKEIREKSGMSQMIVAKKAGISQNYYSSIETGVRGNPLNVDVAKKIAEALGFDWTMFYDEDIRAKEITQDSNKNKKQNANQTIA